jgi:hypothetical protein
MKKKCDEKEKKQENKGQIGVHGGEVLQRPNRRARRRGDAEDNQHSQRGDAEAKSACMEEGIQSHIISTMS